MSIKDHKGDEIVSLPGFWSLAVKVAIALSVPATLSVVSLLAWVVTKTFDHDTRLAVLEDRARPRAAAGTSPSVKVAETRQTNNPASSTP